ncbi:hypothetical protein HDU93_003573 [Gonapodya sp. JEL0774]|nr:hypothetical protein HDU93_003573 [Gonapodya sp. JEL0774]
MEDLGVFDPSEGFLYHRLSRLAQGKSGPAAKIASEGLLRDLINAAQVGKALVLARTHELLGVSLPVPLLKELGEFRNHTKLPLSCLVTSRNQWLSIVYQLKAMKVPSYDHSRFGSNRRTPFSPEGAYHPTPPLDTPEELSLLTLLDRALISQAVPFRLSVPECIDYYCLRTLAGAPLRGGGYYVMTFEGGSSDLSGQRAVARDSFTGLTYKRTRVPATDGCWSVTVCGRDFRTVTDDGASASSIGDLTHGKFLDRGGSLVILFGVSESERAG